MENKTNLDIQKRQKGIYIHNCPNTLYKAFCTLAEVLQKNGINLRCHGTGTVDYGGFGDYYFEICEVRQ